MEPVDAFVKLQKVKIDQVGTLEKFQKHPSAKLKADKNWLYNVFHG